MHKFNYETSKTGNENTRIPKTVKKVVSYLPKGSFFCISKRFLSLEGPTAPFHSIT